MAETEMGEVKAAIVELATIVDTIAQRCWQSLGTAEVNNIGRKCEALVDRIEGW